MSASGAPPAAARSGCARRSRSSRRASAMGLFSKIGDGRRRKLGEFVTPQLPPGETIQATIPMLQTGNPAFESFGLVRFFGIALTERSLYLVSWKQSVPERPNEVIGILPRAGLVVERWSGRGTLELRGAEGTRVELQVPGMHRKDADALVAALPHA